VEILTNPENQAREQIDRLLSQAEWLGTILPAKKTMSST